MMPGIVKTEAAFEDSHDMMRIRQIERVTRDAVVADLARWHPNPVLVDRCQDESFEPCMGTGTLRVDLLAWFERDPRFVHEWVNYVLAGQSGPYDVWCQVGQSQVCQRILAPLISWTPKLAPPSEDAF